MITARVVGATLGAISVLDEGVTIPSSLVPDSTFIDFTGGPAMGVTTALEGLGGIRRSCDSAFSTRGGGGGIDGLGE